MNSASKILLLVLILTFGLGDTQPVVPGADQTIANPDTDRHPRLQSPNQTVVDKGVQLSQDLTSHDPIVINTVESFRNQGWPGEGTEEDPLRISNLSIIGVPGSGDALIAIYSVSAHFIIENCQLIGMGDTRQMSGILLTNVRNGIVQSCDISLTYTGIVLENSEDNLIVNNTIWNSHGGIEISGSNNNVALNNHVVTESQGLFVTNSMDATIEDSVFVQPLEDPIYGYNIEILDSENVQIIGCTVSGHDSFQIDRSINCIVENTEVIGREGARFGLWGSEDCTISNSTFVQISVIIDGYLIEHWNHQFLNVTVDGNLFGFFTDLTDAFLDASRFGQLFILNSNRVVVQDQNGSSSLVSLFLASSQYVEIRDVTLQSSQQGVKINLCQDLRFVNVFVNSSSDPLRIEDSRNITMDNCYFVAEWNGLSIDNTTDFRLRNSTIITEYGAVYLWSSNFAEVSGNTIRSNGTSVAVYDSVNCSISRNSISGWYASLRIVGCLFLTVVDNTLTNVNIWLDGYELEHWIQNFDNSTVNGKPIGYLNREMDTTIDVDEYGQVILVDCEGVTVSSGQGAEFSSTLTIAFSRDCLVQGLAIDYEGESAIRIVFSDDCIIDSISILDLSGPITIDGSQGIHITNSAFLSSWSWTAIAVTDSSYCNISYNTMSSGISIYWNQFTTVTHNIVSSGYDGISLWDSENCDVSYNTIRNVWTGLSLGGLSESIAKGNEIVGCIVGIRMDWSIQMTIAGNIIESSSERGITVWDSDECTISSNVITDSESEGIFLEYLRNSIISWNVVMYNDGGGIWVGPDSSDNFIYGNLVSENSEYQGYDDGSNNHWDDGSQMGNCWGSLLEPEVGIDGYSESIDNHPLYIETEPGTLPIVSSPTDIFVVYGEEFNTFIQWVVWTTEPGAFTVFLNGARFARGELDFSDGVGLFFFDLSLGDHNLTISFGDDTGQQVSDTVFVHVVLVEVHTAVSLVTVLSTASIFIVLAVREVGSIRKSRSAKEPLLIE